MPMSGERSLSPDERDRYIVERLRSAELPVSGEALAAELGVSRVALWKRVEALKAWGYGIEASRKGYALGRDDGLAVWDLDPPGPVALFGQASSTMDEALDWARSGAPSGAMVLALGQSAGRGRGGESWESPAGGLYFSIVLRSALPPSHAGALSLEAALALTEGLAAAGVRGAAFAWPSAVECYGRKAAGILVEPHGDLGAASSYVVGIGVKAALVDLARAVSGAPGTGVGRSEPVAPGEADPGVPARRARLAAYVARRLSDWAASPALDPARWAPLLPADPLAVELWTGESRVVRAAGFDARGDLLPDGGGPALSVGECRSARTLGDGPAAAVKI